MKSSILLFALTLSPFAALAQSDGTVQPRYVRAASLVTGTSPLAWKIKKRTWSAEDEQRYSQFIVSIANALETKQCKTIDTCMRTSANIYRTAVDSQFKFFPADCGRNPYLMRAYFAWKNNLPFSFAASVAPRNPEDPEKNDTRYTVFGNVVTSRADVVAPSANAFPNFISLQDNLMRSVFTGTLRTAARQAPNEPVNDFYTVAISRSTVVPGTVKYYPAGHASMVYKIAPSGAITTFDAHPGNDISIRPFADGYGLLNSAQERGGVLKNFRPVELVGGYLDSEGNIIGGRIVVKTDAEIPGVDYAQTVANKVYKTTSHYKYAIEAKLATSVQIKDIVSVYSQGLDQLCTYVKDRMNSVNKALAAGTDLAPKRETLPRNLIAGDGDDQGQWAALATYGRDINIKNRFRTGLEEIQMFVDLFTGGEPTVVYSGANLPQDLLNVYKAKAMNCRMSYTSRDGSVQDFNLEQVRQRLFKISSDLQFCAELRWGDTERGGQVCPQDMRHYNAQQFLRNMTDRQVLGAVDAAIALESLEIQNQLNNKPVKWNTNHAGYFQDLAQKLGMILQ